MTTDITLKKADIALRILLEHDERDSKISFKHLMEEIIDAWRNN